MDYASGIRGDHAMPIHDWTRVRANHFHDFHQTWTIAIRNALNAGRLPAGYFAIVEQKAGGPEPDVITLGLNPPAGPAAPTGLAVVTAPPKARIVARAETASYARKANRITVRHPDGEVVAVIEIVSPGNKDSRHAIRAFARKAVELLQAGIHLSIVDLFPPNRRDPQGIHQVIWDRIRDAVHVAARQTADSGGLLGRGGNGRLRGARGRRRSAARHAHLPDSGSLRALSTGGDLPDRLGAVSRAAQRAAEIATDLLTC
jgi:hypothetical protein